jgi:hypothetical protein
MRTTRNCRHPVQHLADAFADGMQRTTTTAADITADVEHNVLAREMIGQRFAFRSSAVGLGDGYRTALPDAGNAAVEVFKREYRMNGLSVLQPKVEVIAQSWQYIAYE